MSDRIISLVSANCSVEYTEIIKHCFSFFAEVKYPNFEDHLDEAVDMVKDDNQQHIVENVNACIILMLKTMLSDHGVELNERLEIPLEVLLDITKGIYDVDAYENKADVLRITELKNDAIETLCDLLHYVTKYHPDELLQYFAHVNPSLIKVIHSNAEEATHMEHGNIENEQECVARINKVIKATGKDNYLIVDLLKEGLKTGYAAEVYMTILSPKIAEMDNITLAAELVIIAYISHDTITNPLNFIRNTYTNNVQDLTRVRDIDREVVRLIGLMDQP